jgi:putative membrane protein
LDDFQLVEKAIFFLGLIYATIITSTFVFTHLEFSLPWQPISIIGIAVAFYLGFKNNSSYDRTWEARKIWGGIVNNSRTFGVAVTSFIQGNDSEKVKKELIYRHIAWLTALRYQLRLSREWEHTTNRVNGLYSPSICEDYFEKLDKEMINYITHEEFLSYKAKTNIATQILAFQSKRFQELKNEHYFDDFRHIEFHKLIGTFFDDQGRSERIKNFPFPRQYASTTLWITLMFCILLPFGVLDTFTKMQTWMVWLTIPFSALIIWIFFLMEKIGDYSENPFEGTYNDIPITSISRAIEIDLREMIQDKDIPPAIKPSNGFLM